MPFCTFCGVRTPAEATRCEACGSEVPTAVRQALSSEPTQNIYAHMPPWGYPYGPGTAPPPPQQAPELLKNAGDAITRIWADVRSFNFKWIVPYETALSPRILDNPSTWVMLLFGFFPLLGFMLVRSIEQLLICLVAYFALAWAAYFYVFVANRTTDIRIGAGVAAFTIFIGVSLVLILQVLPPLSFFYGMTGSHVVFERLLGFICGVGVNEELMKALPVLILALHFGRIKKPLDGIFYGAVSGLGFAIPEGYQYITHSANVGGLLVQTLLRTTTLPFLHATWAAISGYFIALAMINRHRRGALCVLGVAVAATLHGLYDFTSGGGTIISVAIAAFVYLLFISYIERSQDMVRELEKAEAMAEAAEAVMSGAPLPPPPPSSVPVGSWVPPPIKAPDTRRMPPD
ncbi:MAG: PrsW family intramembrane metalloprotease [Candidatus Xenobia bacterium]